MSAFLVQRLGHFVSELSAPSPSGLLQSAAILWNAWYRGLLDPLIAGRLLTCLVSCMSAAEKREIIFFGAKFALS